MNSTTCSKLKHKLVLDESNESDDEESYDEVVKEKSIITLTKEMESFKWDDKYWDKRRKKVLNKHARENVCFDDYSSEPNYEEKKGRIVGWNDVPTLNKIRKNIEIIAGKKGMNLKCEGNKYKNDIGKDKKNGGIGWQVWGGGKETTNLDKGALS